ncbi:WXG100 family type VII secretion target [Streptomyces macrosporus]|uniref:ESAT-6-like protein n=1 Tax=Streptomyces macrosporus TaxID=44032 RepID=A0ABN3KFY9_9ACTN
MTIKITYHTVVAAAGDVRKTANDLESQLNALNGRVKSVVDSWDGDAKEAFYRKHRGWDENVTGLNTTLKKIADLLEKASDDYRRTDKKAAAQFEF